MKGLTLLELLIVVVIISVLMMIANPNMQKALIRTKVVRVQVDMFTIANAIEYYRIDNGLYPFETGFPVWRIGDLTILTTPIAYISHLPKDIFAEDYQFYKYQWYSPSNKGGWYVWSIGPDKFNDNHYFEYDPTNGIISKGDISRKGS